ncbi:MAG: HlyD family secretion protein, partial [Paracoccaceae bacterium]
MSGFLCAIPVLSSLFTSCVPPLLFASGYVEGDYVMIAPVATAQIAALHVARGDRMKSGAALVDMEKRDAVIALAQAQASLSLAEASLANLLQGKRPEEIAAIEASLQSARAHEADAVRTADREQNLAEKGAVTTSQRDDAITAAA